MNRIALYAITFIANAAVLVFEIAGVRLLAPYLGTSTEVWSGLIAVILGGLAIGYWLGGRLAGSNPTPQKLAVLLFLAAAAAFLMWVVRNTIPPLVLSALSGLSLTVYAVIAGTILFAPTTILLGAVSPYTVRLAIRTLDSASSLIGNFSAVGAAGSILGAITTGMFLIPYFGLSTIILGVIAVLGLLAVLAAGTVREHAALGLLLVVGAVTIAGTAEPKLAGNVLADVDTPYSRVLVSEVRQPGNGLYVRYLKTDPFGIQCAGVFDPQGFRDDVLLFPYLKAFAVADTLGSPERSLTLGGCNYSFPRFFLHEHPGATMEVVEIDPGMTELARQWFGLTFNPRLSIRHADARTAIREAGEPYDAIFMDTFNSFSSIPFQLTTREFFESVRTALSEDGTLTVNVIGSLEGDRSLFTAALYRTVREVFPSVGIYRIGSSADSSGQNLIFLASAAPGAAFAESFLAYGEALTLVSSEILEKLNARGLLLTDEYAPVESLTKPVRDAVAAAFAGTGEAQQ